MDMQKEKYRRAAGRRTRPAPLAMLAVILAATAVARGPDPAVPPAVADRLQSLPPGSVRLAGPIEERIRRQAELWFDEATLRAMADVYRKRGGGFATGEFWGKAVRALCHHYQYSRDPRLGKLLEVTLADFASTQTPDGCISSYPYGRQPLDTDVWDRKYAFLGLINGYEILGNPEVLKAAVRAADYMLGQVGPPPKVRVFDTHYRPARDTNGFLGVESSSILEPMVRLYRLTGEPRYLEFAKYLVEVEGGTARGSMFEAALAGKDARDFGGDGDPKHSVAHAYSVISCFEGLADYHRATGAERWKLAALNFYSNVLARETTVIGAGCGLGDANQGLAPTEQFSHSGLYQTCPVREGIEGCTHARWMTYCDHLLRLTGDPAIADKYERALYNAFLGSIRPDGLAVDYHTQLNGIRPAKVNYRQTFNGKVITCCLYNVFDTLALIPFVAVMQADGGPVVNLYIPGTAAMKLADGNEVMIEQVTDYPKTGAIAILVRPLKPARFPIRVRIPEWSALTRAEVNGEAVATKPGSYLCLDRTWSKGDRISLALDMRCRLTRSPEGSPQSADGFRALVRGPVVLARDKRLGGDIHEEVEIRADTEGFVELSPMPVTISAQMQFAVPTVGGGRFPVVDFASSGNTWDERSERVTWIPRPGPPRPRWIWFPDAGSPAVQAPVGRRWFRRGLEIPAGRAIKQATVTMCADNEFTLFVNGRRIGTGSSWQQPVQMDIRPALEPGPAILAVEAANTDYKGPNAAGLLGRMRIVFAEGPPITLFTDGTWKSSDRETTGWQETRFEDDGWKPVRVLGDNGMTPWGGIAELKE